MAIIIALMVNLMLDMSRILSEILGAPELQMRLGIQKLERASGHDSADIRLTSELLRASKVKLHELGLNPHDTTGPELYQALAQRLKTDDERLKTALQAASKQDDVIVAVADALKRINIPRSCFGLKSVVAKKLLQKSPPKKAMKQLGYRSLDSMLKHESVAAIFAAAHSLESATWRKSLTDKYKQLKPQDFESRDIAIVQPSSARWQKLGVQIATDKKHLVLGFKELGAIVLLPLPADTPEAITTASLVLALHEMNEIRAASTFLKLCQVKPDFGTTVHDVVTSEPEVSVDVLSQPVGWQVIQRYYSRFKASFESDMFEHLHEDDLSWHSIEHALTELEPSMAFWQDTDALTHLYEHQPVSFNIIDVALAYCNQLPYADRIVHYGRISLWHELLLRYLKHEHVEQTMLSQLQPQLVTEPALAL